MEFNYIKLAKVCLYADGGNCYGCAMDVAEGFSKEFKEIDLEKLKIEIKKQYADYEKESDRKFQEYLTKEKVKEDSK